jgi:hypothetical protein
LFITSNDPAGSDVLSGTQRYRLLNRTLFRKVRYGERPVGINLNWGLTGGATNIRFEKLEDDGRPLHYNGSVAIHIDDGGYLHQEWRSFGVELGWSSEPVYHWRIHGPDVISGRPVRTNYEIAIYSKPMRGWLIQREQMFGIDLGWWIPPDNRSVLLRRPGLLRTMSIRRDHLPGDLR